MHGKYVSDGGMADDAQAPAGWTKWTVPGYEYIYAERETEDTFPNVLNYLKDNGLSLVGAAHDFTCPQTGKNYMFFPIGRL